MSNFLSINSLNALQVQSANGNLYCSGYLSVIHFCICNSCTEVNNLQFSDFAPRFLSSITLLPLILYPLHQLEMVVLLVPNNMATSRFFLPDFISDIARLRSTLRSALERLR